MAQQQIKTKSEVTNIVIVGAKEIEAMIRARYPHIPADARLNPNTDCGLLNDLLLDVRMTWNTLDFDTKEERLRYARAGIREYWVVDINGRRLLVYRDSQSGDYASQQVLASADAVSPLATPSASVRVAGEKGEGKKGTHLIFLDQPGGGP